MRTCEVEPAVRIELTTHGLQNRCSTAELSRRSTADIFCFVRFPVKPAGAVFINRPSQIRDSKSLVAPNILMWATPYLTASTGNDGLSSKTLM